MAYASLHLERGPNRFKTKSLHTNAAMLGIVLALIRSQDQKQKARLRPIPPTSIAGMEEYSILKAKMDDNVLILTVEPKTHSEACIYESCQGLPGKLIKNGFKLARFVHVPIANKPCVVEIRRQRYLCPNCGRGQSDPLPGLDQRHWISHELVTYIRINSSEPNTHLAKLTGLCARTIQHVIDEFADEIAHDRCSELPTQLGIDEIYLGGMPHCVLTDIDKKVHFDLLSDNKDRTLRGALRSYPNLDAVKVVTIDMTGHYREAVRDLLPNARVVIDHFHVVQLADSCRNAVRRKAAELVAPEAKPQLRGRKDFWEMFDGPNGWDGVPDVLFGERMPSVWLANSLYKRFCQLFETNTTAASCAQEYDRWAGDIPEDLLTYFSPLLRSLREFRAEIFAYVELRKTNGFTEGNNKSIRDRFRGAPNSRGGLQAKLLASAEIKYRAKCGLALPSEVAPKGNSVAASIARSRRMVARRGNSHPDGKATT